MKSHWGLPFLGADPPAESPARLTTGDGHIEVFTGGTGSNVTPIAQGMREKGFAVADVDGGGKPKLVKGQAGYARIKRHADCYPVIICKSFRSVREDIPRTAAGGD